MRGEQDAQVELLYAVRSERQFCERFDYDLLFRFFLVTMRQPAHLRADSSAARVTSQPAHSQTGRRDLRLGQVRPWVAANEIKGRRRTWDGSYLIMAAYNLSRMMRLLRATG